jgi:hypothetical protein
MGFIFSMDDLESRVSKCTLGLHYVGLETNLTPERTGRTVTRRTRFLGESGPYYAEGQYSDARWSLEAPL